MTKKPLNDEEIAAVKRRRLQARASSACEGIFLTPEEEALFEEFDRERLPHEERHRRIDAYLDATIGKPRKG